MKIDIQDLSDVEKTIRVEVSADEMRQERETTLREMQKKAKVKGFRPGKVPFAMLEKLYSSQIDYELQDRVLQQRSRRAFEEHGLIPVGQAVLHQVQFTKDSPLLFELKIEVKPKLSFESSAYHGLALKRPSLAASPVEVDAELARLQEGQAELEPVAPETVLGAGLVAVIDFEGSIDGKAFQGGSAKNHLLELGKGMVLQEFEQGLQGLGIGAETTIELTFPEDYFVAHLRGKHAQFHVKVDDIKHKVLPTLDDEFVKDLGSHESLVELRAALAERIADHKAQACKPKLYEQIVDQLTAAIPCPVPPSLLAHEKKLAAEHGHSEHDHEHPPKADTSAQENAARRRLQGDFILEQIAIRETCTVEAGDLEARVEQIALASRKPAAEIIEYYRKNNLFPYLQFQILIQKALDKVIEYATITEE